MGLSQPERSGTSCQGAGAGGGSGEVYRPPARAHRNKQHQIQEKIRSVPAKPRRPDRAVYVPRAKRCAETALHDPDSTELHNEPDLPQEPTELGQEPIKYQPEQDYEREPIGNRQEITKINRESLGFKQEQLLFESDSNFEDKQSELRQEPSLFRRESVNSDVIRVRPKSVELRSEPEIDSEPLDIQSQLRDRSQPPTPKRSDKKYCNLLYTPPHLRNLQKQEAPSIENEYKTNLVPNLNNSVSENNRNNTYAANSISVLRDNCNLGFYKPDKFYENEYTFNYENTNEMMDTNPNDNVILDTSDLTYNKDEDFEQNELKRASEEINRSNRRIIKQSFNSDVLVISDPIKVKPELKVEPKTELNEDKAVIPKPKVKLEAKLSLKREENDWEAVFDDSGECLDPTLLEELTSTVGKVQIAKPKNNYEQYQSKGQVILSGSYDEAFAHVVEVYNFPTEFKTNDILAVFSDFKDTGFEIKWVDDSHALIVFSSSKIAADVLSLNHPLVRTRPLHEATLESMNKAKKCAEFLQPYRQRPETCTALARRLVSGALGVKLSTAQQERAEERRLIGIAREKKRQAALHKEAAWDGSLSNQNMDSS